VLRNPFGFTPYNRGSVALLMSLITNFRCFRVCDRPSHFHLWICHQTALVAINQPHATCLCNLSYSNDSGLLYYPISGLINITGSHYFPTLSPKELLACFTFTSQLLQHAPRGSDTTTWFSSVLQLALTRTLGLIRQDT